MQLTAQQLSGVIATLQGEQAKAGADQEKRRFSRVQVHARITAAALADQRATRIYSALTRDISFSGMGLTQSAACQPGERLAVSLPSGHKKVLVITCTVMHCRAMADGIHGIGVEFAELLPPDFLEKAANPELEMQRIRQSILG